MAEEWKPVLGYEGKYEVSSLGRVRSLRIVSRNVNRLRNSPLVLSPALNGAGRLAVNLCNKRKRKGRPIHLIVLDAFQGPKPPGCEGSHIDGDLHNNRADNLVWETRIENNARKAGHGTQVRGETANCAKLTDAKVREIKTLLARGISKAAIGRQFGVSGSTVSEIAMGRKWKHVT